MNKNALRRTRLSTLLLIAAALPATGVAQDAYDYSTVTLPGSAGSQAFGINERGQIAGNAFFEEGNIPFTYDIKKDRFNLVDDVAGFDRTIILANSNRGDLVGSVVDETAGTQSGLVLDRRGHAEVFDHPDAVTQTSARGISSNGTVVGIRDSAEPSEFLASFIYDPADGSFTDIVPSALTIAQGINGRGDVVGSAIFFTENDPCNPGQAPGGIVRYAWIRSDDGDVRYFTVNGGASSARGLTDSGTIAGFVRDAATGESAGYVTEAPENCSDVTVGPEGLVIFPGATETFLAGISNSGKIVGQYNDAEGAPQTFVATPK